MATLNDIITQIQERPNAQPYSEIQLTRWISELEGELALHVFLLSITEAEQLQMSWPEDKKRKLLVRYPYDSLYLLWVDARIEYEQHEYSSYNDAIELYNRKYSDYCRWFRGTYNPADGCRQDPPYYLTAYGLAVMTGFKGSLEEWLESLVGRAGDRVELRYDNKQDALMWRLTVTEGETPTPGVDYSWQVLIALADIRGPIIEKTLAQAQASADAAAESAAAAGLSADAAAGSATAAAGSAEEAAASAAAAKKMIVHFTGDFYTPEADHTYEEAAQAIADGKTVSAVFDGQPYDLADAPSAESQEINFRRIELYAGKPKEYLLQMTPLRISGFDRFIHAPNLFGLILPDDDVYDGTAQKEIKPTRFTVGFEGNPPMVGCLQEFKEVAAAIDAKMYVVGVYQGKNFDLVSPDTGKSLVFRHREGIPALTETTLTLHKDNMVEYRSYPLEAKDSGAERWATTKSDGHPEWAGLDDLYTYFYNLRKSGTRREQIEAEAGKNENIGNILGLPEGLTSKDSVFWYFSWPYSEAGGFCLDIELVGRSKAAFFSRRISSTNNGSRLDSGWTVPGGSVTPAELNQPIHTTLNVEIEDDGFGGYRADHNDAEINNHRNAGGIVTAKYYDSGKNQTYTYYYSTMESDRKPTFIRTYIDANGAAVQVLASVGNNKRVTVERRTTAGSEIKTVTMPTANTSSVAAGQIAAWANKGFAVFLEPYDQSGISHRAYLTTYNSTIAVFVADDVSSSQTESKQTFYVIRGTAVQTVVVPGGDISLGIKSAKVGDLARITAVDATGKPTEWEPTTLEEMQGKWELITSVEGDGSSVFRFNTALKKLRIFISDKTGIEINTPIYIKTSSSNADKGFLTIQGNSDMFATFGVEYGIWTGYVYSVGNGYSYYGVYRSGSNYQYPVESDYISELYTWNPIPAGVTLTIEGVRI